ncbi:MAG: shikimate dehydrogenase [Sporichthyaceae bacterium]
MTRAAVLGSPIQHSLSPVLHAAAYRALGLDWTYTAHEVDEAGLATFLDGLLHLDATGVERWAGLSLTMPLKRVAAGLCAEVSTEARAVSAVNTITFGPGGRRRGDNTDIGGLRGALAERGITAVASATILGGGATAASALAALAPLCTGTVTAYVRSPPRGAELSALAEEVGVDLAVHSWERACEGLHAPVVIATTPKGGVDHLAVAVPARPGALFDVVYDPWPTALAAAWSATGAVVIGGLDLLTHQGVLQVELMTGAPVDRPALVAVMRAAGEAELSRRALSPRNPR